MRKTFIYDVAKMTVNSSAPVKVVCKKNLLTPPKKLVGGGGRVESRNLNKPKFSYSNAQPGRGLGYRSFKLIDALHRLFT